MANEITLTMEEREMILKRRQRAARKAKKDGELLKATLEALPSLTAFLNHIGVSKDLETKREERYQLHGLHVTLDGFISGETYYSRNSDENDSTPIYELQFENITKICGKKLPFTCYMIIGMLGKKVVKFALQVVDAPIRDLRYLLGYLLSDSVLTDRYEYRHSENKGLIIRANKEEFRKSVLELLQQFYVDLSTNIEKNFLRRKEEYEAEVKRYTSIKKILGANYQPRSDK